MLPLLFTLTLCFQFKNVGTRKYWGISEEWENKKCSKECELDDIFLRPHTASVSWHGPNRLTAFAFSHSGEHKDRICLWQKSTPTFLSYVLTSVLSAPLSCSLPLRSDTKTLAHIAVHCKVMQTLTCFSWTRREVKLTDCLPLEVLSSPKLAKPTVTHADHVGLSSFRDGIHFSCSTCRYSFHWNVLQCEIQPCRNEQEEEK